MTLEELNKLQPEPIPLSEKRYKCVWWADGDRFVVLVIDKLSAHAVYKSRTKNKMKAYLYIKDYYKEAHCDPPSRTPADPRLYEGL